MKYDLYHLPYANDTEADAAYLRHEERVRQAGGLLWPAHNHGNGPHAYLVIALRATTNPETREEIVGQLASEYTYESGSNDDAAAKLFDEAAQHGILVHEQAEEEGGDEQ